MLRDNMTVNTGMVSIESSKGGIIERTRLARGSGAIRKYLSRKSQYDESRARLH